MVRRLLFVCTANVCRSAVAEQLFGRELAGHHDIDGEEWVVRSAGTADLRAAMDRSTIAAADAVGLDLRGHLARPITREIIATDGADLVLTMTREHLRHVIGLDPTAWPRTLTMKEAARRSAAIAGPTAATGGFAGWRDRLTAGRRAADLMRPDAADDVADPYGAPRREHDQMVATVAAAAGVLTSRLLAPT